MIKKSLLVSLIATTFAAQSSALEVYGKANISLNVNTESEDLKEDKDVTELNSNASRIGFKGSIDLGEGLEAIYKFEYETFVDDGAKSSKTESGDDKYNKTFSQRNIAAGFKGAFGSIIAGKHDTPTKLAQGKVDLFNDLPNADIKKLIEGENRADNIIIYSTPTMNGLKASFAYIPDEKESINSISSSSSIQYKENDLTLTIAHDDGTAIDSDIESLTRYVAEYKIGNLKIGAIVQNTDAVTEGEDEDAQIVSLAYKASPKTTFKLQVGESEVESTEKSQGAFGIDYKLNKKSKLFAYYSNIETDKNDVDSNVSTIGAGYEIKF